MIGQKIKEVREAKSISRRELAAKIGVHYSMIEGIENDRWKPSLETFARLVEALDLSADDLLGALVVEEATP